MKPAPFRYHRPASLDQALGLLADLPNARLLAGGQSIVPMLNLRIAFTDDLIDINRLPELEGIVEGAEDEETVAVLRELGVTDVQGFVYGRPDTRTGAEQRLLTTGSAVGDCLD